MERPWAGQRTGRRRVNTSQKHLSAGSKESVSGPLCGFTDTNYLLSLNMSRDSVPSLGRISRTRASSKLPKESPVKDRKVNGMVVEHVKTLGLAQEINLLRPK